MWNNPSWRHTRGLSKVVVALLRLYQRTLSMLIGGRCRFYPSCSEYARLAVDKHGLLRGGTLSLWRLMRCNPWHPGGVDEP